MFVVLVLLLLLVALVVAWHGTTVPFLAGIGCPHCSPGCVTGTSPTSQCTGQCMLGGSTPRCSADCMTPPRGAMCSGSSNFVGINVSNLALTGTVPVISNAVGDDGWGDVSTIDLSRNALRSALPVWFGELSRLTHLDASSNRFNSSLPPSLFGLTSLKTLNVSRNSFDGILNVTRMANLESLDASSNLLVRVDLTRASRLTTVNLANCQLNHTLDFSRLSSLKALNLRDNKFAGSLNLSAIATLTSLIISGNSFSKLTLSPAAAASLSECVVSDTCLENCADLPAVCKTGQGCEVAPKCPTYTTPAPPITLPPPAQSQSVTSLAAATSTVSATGAVIAASSLMTGMTSLAMSTDAPADSNIPLIAGATAGGVCLLLALLVLFFVCRSHRKQESKARDSDTSHVQMQPTKPVEIGTYGSYGSTTLAVQNATPAPKEAKAPVVYSALASTSHEEPITYGALTEATQPIVYTTLQSGGSGPHSQQSQSDNAESFVTYTTFTGE
jgi:hypothetical protein